MLSKHENYLEIQSERDLESKEAALKIGSLGLAKQETDKLSERGTDFRHLNKL